MLAHVHIMKTAGQTVCDILRSSFGANHCDLRAGELATLGDVRFAHTFYPNLQSIAGHAVRPWNELAEFPGLRFFTFLREPVSRCLSHYQFECQRNGHDGEFLPWLERNANYQTRILSGTDQAERAIQILEERIGFTGLVEDFDRSLLLLGNWSGHDLNIHYRSRNVAKSSAVKKQVLADPRNVNALQSCHEADVIVYQYLCNEIYPRQIEQYASEPEASRSPNSISTWWPMAKRDLLYKPAAKLRQMLRAS